MSSQAQRKGPSFKTWSKGFSVAPVACGKTAGTFGVMGNIKIPNKDKPMFLYGFLVNIVLEATTAGQSGYPIMKVNSSDVGLINEVFPLVSMGASDAIGTNSKAIAKRTIFVPIEVLNQVNNKSFEISFTSSQTLTNDWIGYVSGVFGNLPKASLPSDYTLEVISHYSSFVSSLGRYANDNAKAIATAEVEVSLSDITVPAKAKQLTSILAMITSNAPTAAEYIAAMMIFNAGDISDFSPQEYPCCVSFSASLGTPVGGARVLPGRGYPVRFPLPGTEFSFSATVKNPIALSNPPDVLQSVEFRTFEQR